MKLLPTRNSKLPLHRAGFASVPAMLDHAAQGETGVTFYNAKGEQLSALPWRDIRDRAQVVARKLIGAGFARGERILITADTWPGFFDSFFGAQYAGLLPVPVSIPVGIGGKDAYGYLIRGVYGEDPQSMFVLASASLRLGGWTEQATKAVEAGLANSPQSEVLLREKQIVDTWRKRLEK